MAEPVGPLSIVLSTFETADQARAMVRLLVEERLIACGNIVPGIGSIYRWKGTIEETGEVLLLMKTRTELLPALRRRVGELHPYEVPEFLAFSVDEVAAAYGRWVWQETIEVIE